MDERPPGHVLAAFGLKDGEPQQVWDGGWRPLAQTVTRQSVANNLLPAPKIFLSVGPYV